MTSQVPPSLDIAPHRFAWLIWSGLVACLLIGAMGCGTGVRRTIASGKSSCRVVDSLYARSGFGGPLKLMGRATVDADHHRFRGKMVLSMETNGDVIVEFTSSVLFGSQREDFVFAVVGDTTRILDRERGQFYEEEAAERYLGESLGIDFDVAEVLRLALGGYPACESLRDLGVRTSSSGRVTLDGHVGGEPFRAVFRDGDGRLHEVSWPVFLRSGERDLVHVSYDWGDPGVPGPSRLVIRFERREWRCRISQITS